MSDLYDREQAEAAEEAATGGIFSGISDRPSKLLAKLQSARTKIKVQAKIIKLLEARLDILQSHFQTILQETSTAVLNQSRWTTRVLPDDDISDHEDEVRNYTPDENNE